MVEPSPKKQRSPVSYCIYVVSNCEINDLLVIGPSDPEDAEVDLEKRVVDRALGISECAVTDASMNCFS